jgi:hypothetical protein
MKPSNWISAALIAIAMIIAGYFIGNLQVNGKKYDRYVSVKGLSEREVAADLAVWPINIVLTGNDLEELRERIQNQKWVRFAWRGRGCLL